MQFLTDFADMAILLPVALCVAAWLVVGGWARGARLWILAFAAVLLAMLALKLAILGCRPSDTVITSPSGHTAAATFVYGGIIVLILRCRFAASLAIGILLAVLFGVSRILVHAHTVPDVVAGGVVGVAVLAAFAYRASPAPGGLRPALLLLVCVPLVLLLHGVRLDLEPHLRGASHWLGLTVCLA